MKCISILFVVGWGRDQINQPQGFGQEEKGIKQQLANLIHAVRTVMRGINDTDGHSDYQHTGSSL